MTRTETFSLEFLTELQRLYQEHRTGLLLITGAKRMVQLNLEHGEIVYLACSDKRGAEALPLLQEISSGKLRFVEGSTLALRTPLPTTSEILSYLGAGRSVSAPTPARPASEQQLSAPVRTVLQQKLAEFIGPMALFVCEERLVGVHDLETAMVTLSQVLPNPVQVDRFKENVRKQLG